MSIRLASPRFVSGTVRWTDGKPASAANVEGDRADVHLIAGGTTDAEGRYRLGPFPAGTHVVVRASPLGIPRLGTRYRSRRVRRADGTFEVVRQELDTPHARNVVVGADDVTGIDLTLERATGTISGTVTDEGGRPLERVTVVATGHANAYAGADWMLLRDDNRAVTRGDGTFVLGELPPEPQTLVALHPDLGRTVVEDVPVGTKGVQIRVARAGRLTGTVKGADGRPVPVFSLTVQPKVYSINGTGLAHLDVADAAGNFQVAPCPAGDLSLVVTDPSSGARTTESVTVAPGQEARVDVRLPPPLPARPPRP